MKIVTVLGARPQFVKAAAISRAIKTHNEKQNADGISSGLINEIIVHTGQHYDDNMSDVFFDEMRIPKPHYRLNVQSPFHGAMTGRMLEKVEAVLIKENPDLVLVYGDTNSTLAGALAARKLNLTIAHVEAGLRNHDLSIPEDVNRILTDRISDILFVPTKVAYENLKSEGFLSFPCEIVQTGDIMADNVFFYASIADNAPKLLDKLGLSPLSYILCTFHRASNTTAESIAIIVDSLNEIAKQKHIILPLHPRTRQTINEYGFVLGPSIITLQPVGYVNMLQLLKAASFVITDSGGLQKEAYLMKINSLLLMDYTPWEELVAHGFSTTTSICKSDILKQFRKATELSPDYTINLYGDGHASDNIVNYLHQYLLKGGKQHC